MSLLKKHACEKVLAKPGRKREPEDKHRGKPG
jgi:hypothetical protein